MGWLFLKILLLSFYYHPDLCAGSFRATALVDALLPKMPPGSRIDVVTTLPNRYQSFSSEAQHEEHHPGLSVLRIAVPQHQSGMLDQSRCFATFARASAAHAAKSDYDLVFATSSRLMTAFLGAWIAARKGARLYLDIRDIFVDTLKDVLPSRLAGVVTPCFSLLERWTLGRADRINLVSRGFAEYFGSRYPGKSFSFFTNGIDEEFLTSAPALPRVRRAEEPLTVLYAGNLGEGQGLHKIVPELALRMGDRVRFRIIGDGGRKAALASALDRYGLTSVELLPPMARDRLLLAYRDADVLFLHLNDYDAFKKVLPSKIFEYAALGKPVWAGVSGYAADFLRTEVANSAVFHPCDADAAVAVFQTLTLQEMERRDFVAKFSRGSISSSLAEDILNTLQDRSGACIS